MARLTLLLALTASLAAGCRATIELDPGGGLGACLPVGSACREASECCSGACEGFCTALEGCRPGGESCAAAADCCSHVCASDGEGRVICQQLGGCRVMGEICGPDVECCGEATCVVNDPVTGIGRCTLDGACGGPGEICHVNGDATAMRDCCPGSGTRIQCRASEVRSIDRCLAETTDCAPDGGPCAAPGDCCGGRCVPDALGSLVCSAACVAGTGRCTSDADCCSGACASDAHCAAATRRCAAIAEPCTLDAECCSALCESDACSSPLF